MRNEVKYISYLSGLNQVPFIFTNTKGVTYQAFFKKPDKRIGEDIDGLCDDPDDEEPKIYIRPGMSNRREMNTCIHELCHAFFWDKSETDVSRYADTVSNYLYKLGWRKVEDPVVNMPYPNKEKLKAKAKKK
jgi:hypothetical protein